MRERGVLQPLLVRLIGREYEIVCGQRRFQACKALGLSEIVAVVRMLDDRQAFELAVAENTRRGPLTAGERDEAFRRLRDIFPGRPAGELEEWLGPLEEVATAVSDTAATAAMDFSFAPPTLTPGELESLVPPPVESAPPSEVSLPDWIDQIPGAGDPEELGSADSSVPSWSRP